MTIAGLVCAGNSVSYLNDDKTVTVELPSKALYAIRVGEAVVVLYNWFGMEASPDECQANVLAFDRAGSLMWRVQPFDFHEGSAYTGLHREGDKLVAYVDRGFEVEVDPATGRVLSSKFTK